MFRAEQRGEGAARPATANGSVKGVKAGLVRPAAGGEDTGPDATDAQSAALAP